jgi:hypothetical protein
MHGSWNHDSRKGEMAGARVALAETHAGTEIQGSEKAAIIETLFLNHLADDGTVTVRREQSANLPSFLTDAALPTMREVRTHAGNLPTA